MSVETAVPWYVTWRIISSMRGRTLDTLMDTVMDKLTDAGAGEPYDVDLGGSLADGSVEFTGYVDAAGVEDAYRAFRSHVQPLAASLQPYRVVEIGARMADV